MGQTRVLKASRTQWFSFLLGVLHVFGLSLSRARRKKNNEQTECTGQPKETKRKTNKTSNKKPTKMKQSTKTKHVRKR